MAGDDGSHEGIAQALRAWGPATAEFRERRPPRAGARRLPLEHPLLSPFIMKYELLKTFRRNLVGRHRAALERRRHSLADEQDLLAEREPDWPDAASNETSAALLEGLSETERRTIATIQAALLRIERGTYGKCVTCNGPIGLARLNALPEADRCADCAGVTERG
jgi:RNA polymerase-binding protein DksA